MLIAARLSILALAIAAFFGSRFAVQQLSDHPESQDSRQPLIIGLTQTPTPSPPPWPAPRQPHIEENTSPDTEGIHPEDSGYEVSTEDLYIEEPPANSESEEPAPSTGSNSTQQESGGGSGSGSEVIEEGRVGG